MAYKYIVAIANGKNFILGEDNDAVTIVGYPGNLYAVTDDDLGQSWINRVGGVEKTKVEAQTIVDAAMTVIQEDWDTFSDEKKEKHGNVRPPNVTII